MIVIRVDFFYDSRTGWITWFDLAVKLQSGPEVYIPQVNFMQVRANSTELVIVNIMPCC